jgi:uncharacterized protein
MANHSKKNGATMKKKLAIIGTGISGLTCGYHLTDKYDLTLFESKDYIGGHTHTVRVQKEDEVADIDTGFIVFNDRTYPHFIELMNKIGVEFQPTEMSFSVRNDSINLEYNGHSIISLFAQRSNIVRLSFLKMLADINRFHNDVRKVAAHGNDVTIGAYLSQRDYSQLFRENYLLPMISAIWSMGLESCMEFPLKFFVRFFTNHGLLSLTDRPQWYTIIGGSSRYIEPLTRDFRDNIRLSTPVKTVKREENRVLITTDHQKEYFDEVIFACHGDQALRLLENPTQYEKNVLENFRFTKNQVILHTDTSHLPKRKNAWASWNYRMLDAGQEKTTLTYNMNILQCLDLKHTYLVSLNQHIDERHILGEYSYDHPVYSPESISAQEQWQSISGIDKIHYCGAYWLNGFHEDGVRSGLRVCKMLESH